MGQINFLGSKIFNLTSQALHVELKRLAKSERAKSAHVMVECKKRVLKGAHTCLDGSGWTTQTDLASASSSPTSLLVFSSMIQPGLAAQRTGE